jgi:Ala-tRNA(Pro) deacylase
VRGKSSPTLIERAAVRAPGAIPPIGECYGLDAVVERSVCDQPDVYFEGGDHATLVPLSQSQFVQLTGHAPHARFAAGD